MRTTLTLDDDVAVLLERARAERGGSLKEVVNDALRRGLRHLDEELPGEPYRTPPASLGRLKVGSLDDVAEALAAAEGEEFR